MSFAPKICRTGLLDALNPASPAAPKVIIRDSNRNGSCEKYQPQGTCGDYIATEIYGDDSAPSESFALALPLTTTVGQLKLNKVTSVVEGTSDTRKYGLESVTISTSAASAVKISATAKQLESTAADASQSYYPIPVFSIATRQCAQDIFGAFTLGGTGCKLTECQAVIGCSISTEKVAGNIVASDCNSGVITVSGKILRLNSVTGNTEPTITAKAEAVSFGNGASGQWVVTKSPTPTETNPETSFKTYDFELQLCLVRTVPDESIDGE